LKRSKKISIIAVSLFVVMVGTNSVYSQNQRRFFIKKKKPYAFSMFVGSVRGLGFSGRIRIFNGIQTEAMIGVTSFIESRYFTPYPGNIVSFSLRLRSKLYKSLYVAGGIYMGLFNVTESSNVISSQLFKWMNGATLSFGLKNFFKKRVGLEAGAVFGLPESSSDIVSTGDGIYLVKLHREPKELSFSPLITVNINL